MDTFKFFDFEVVNGQGVVSTISIGCHCETADEAVEKLGIADCFVSIRFIG